MQWDSFSNLNGLRSMDGHTVCRELLASLRNKLRSHCKKYKSYIIKDLGLKVTEISNSVQYDKLLLP